MTITQAIASYAIEKKSDINATKSRSSSYFPGLDGLRLFSAYGVVLTHVAFQTGHSRQNIFDMLLGRLDLAVAVFFALSGFLLWRPYIDTRYLSKNSSTYAQTPDFPQKIHPSPKLFFRYTIQYYLHRILRIMPAYWIVVLSAFFLLPSLHFSSAQVIWANLGLYQIYRPLDLVDGLTQMWSLDVEMSFYLILPLVAWILTKLNSFILRIVMLAASFILSLLWWTIPFSGDHPGIALHNTLPGYWCWFASGIILAELYNYLESPSASSLLRKYVSFTTRIDLTLILCIICYVLVISPWGGPPGFFTPTTMQRILRLLVGSIIAYLLIGRQIFLQHSIQPHSARLIGKNIFSLSNPFLASLGKWAYGVFLWHLLLLIAIMSLNYIFPFHGHFFLLAGSTLFISTLVGGLSYIFIEFPCTHWSKNLEKFIFFSRKPDTQPDSQLKT